MTKSSTRAILCRNAWFGGLPPELQSLILDKSIIKVIEKGEIISNEDEKPTGLFAVLEGQVAITRRIGVDRTFFYYLGGPGFWFGELGPLAEATTVVTASARSIVRIILLPITQFQNIVAGNPKYYRCFAQLALMRAALVMRTLSEASGLSPIERLRNRLSDMAALFHQDGTDGPIELALSQSDIAHMIGSSRQTVNALLKDLDREGLIGVGFGKITINDRIGLQSGHSSKVDSDAYD